MSACRWCRRPNAAVVVRGFSFCGPRHAHLYFAGGARTEAHVIPYATEDDMVTLGTMLDMTLDSLAGRLDALETAMPSLGADVVTLQRDLAGLRVDVTTLKTSLEDRVLIKLNEIQPAIAALTSRVLVLETGTPLPTGGPPPDPGPEPPGGEAHLRATLGVRTPPGSTSTGGLNATFDALIAQLGRIPAFYRLTLAHTSYDTMSGNAWSVFTDRSEAHFGFLHKFPSVSTSIILPLIAGNDLPLATRTSLLQRTVNGTLDEWWQEAIWDRVSQAPPGVVHRFCLASEAELSPNTYAYSMQDVDIGLWKDAFAYVAQQVHDAGHLVVYAGDGPFINPNANPAPPAEDTWLEYGLPPTGSYDILGCDIYWSIEQGSSMTTSLSRFEGVAGWAEDLGVSVAYPEYGPEIGVGRTDAQRLAWLEAVWDFLATLPSEGPGSLDHHCLWHTQTSKGDWRLSPMMLDAFVARFAE